MMGAMGSGSIMGGSALHPPGARGRRAAGSSVIHAGSGRPAGTVTEVPHWPVSRARRRPGWPPAGLLVRLPGSAPGRGPGESCARPPSRVRVMRAVK